MDIIEQMLAAQDSLYMTVSKNDYVRAAPRHESHKFVDRACSQCGCAYYTNEALKVCSILPATTPAARTSDEKLWRAIR